MVRENKIPSLQRTEPKEEEVKVIKEVAKDTITSLQKNLDKTPVGGRKGTLSRIEAKLKKGGLSKEEIADKEAKAERLRASSRRTGHL